MNPAVALTKQRQKSFVSGYVDEVHKPDDPHSVSTFKSFIEFSDKALLIFHQRLKSLRSDKLANDI